MTVVPGESVVHGDSRDWEVSGEDLLEQARTDLQQIVYMATHDLRAPLWQVVALASNCRDALEQNDRDAVRRALGLLEGRALRALRLHEDLLAFTRTYDAPVTEWVAVDIWSVAHAVWSNVGADDIELKLVGSRSEVKAPPLLIGTLLHVALANVVQHRSSRTSYAKVTVRVDPHSGLTLTVRDDGKGVDPEALQRVLLPFERGANEAQPGSGLGLPLAARACRAHGGDIALRNMDDGGLQVELGLPRVRPVSPD